MDEALERARARARAAGGGGDFFLVEGGGVEFAFFFG